jgi:hypothetical protein
MGRFETRALSDDQLDAVSGGFFPMGLAGAIDQVARATDGGGGSADTFGRLLQQMVQGSGKGQG